MRGKNEIDTNNNSELKEENEDTIIKEEQLNKIAKEIDDNKSRSIIKKEKKYKDIIRNVLIAILITIYFAILFFGNGKVSTINYITALKSVIVIDLIVSIILFEIGFKRDSFTIGLHGLEMAFVGGFSICLLELVSKEKSNINVYFSIFIGIVALYYIIKSAFLAFKKEK